MKKSIVVLFTMLSLRASSMDDPMNGDGIVPVDGGISLLLAAGAGLAARKFLGQRRPVQSPPESDE
jgi:hypothetical protein